MRTTEELARKLYNGIYLGIIAESELRILLEAYANEIKKSVLDDIQLVVSTNGLSVVKPQENVSCDCDRDARATDSSQDMPEQP